MSAGLPIERLLLVQPRWMGDVLLCTPAIRAARRAFPEARIEFFTEKAGAEVLRGNPHLDDVLVADGAPGTRLRLLRVVSARGYDAVVDFRSTGSTAMLTLVSRAPTRVGVRGGAHLDFIYTNLVERNDGTTYMARSKLDMLRPLGIDTAGVRDLSLDLVVGEAAAARAADFWARHDLSGSPVVAVTPTSRAEPKQWGLERWAAVADALIDDGAKVMLTHAPGEEAQVGEVRASMRHAPIPAAGATTIEDLAARLARCDLWAGNEGGAKHIAAAVGTPTVAVGRWRTGPAWTDTAGSVPHVFIDHEPPGACDLKCTDCPTRGCLSRLGPEPVIARVRAALADALAARSSRSAPSPVARPDIPA